MHNFVHLQVVHSDSFFNDFLQTLNAFISVAMGTVGHLWAEVLRAQAGNVNHGPVLQDIWLYVENPYCLISGP